MNVNDVLGALSDNDVSGTPKVDVINGTMNVDEARDASGDDDVSGVFRIDVESIL